MISALRPWRRGQKRVIECVLVKPISGMTVSEWNDCKKQISSRESTQKKGDGILDVVIDPDIKP